MGVMKRAVWTVLLLTIGFVEFSNAQEFRRDHEIRLGVGAFPYSWWGYEWEGGEFYDSWNEPAIDLQDRRRETDLYIAGSFFASYDYQVLKWLQLGMAVSYTRFWQNYSTAKSTSSYTTVIPFVNITWLNRGIVKMYSGVGVGLDFISEKDSGVCVDKFTVDPGFQLTFVGISLGRRLFGFTEVGLGNHGIFTVGMGYRFKK